MANRLGTEGQGFNIAMHGLNGGRINIGELADDEQCRPKTFQPSLSSYSRLGGCGAKVLSTAAPLYIIIHINIWTL